MTAYFGYGKGGGYSGAADGGPIEFGVISDGKKTQFMFPSDTPEEEIDSMLISFGVRLNAFKDETDPEEIVGLVGYNMGVIMEVSEELDTFEAGVERLTNLLSIEDDFETQEFELYDSRLPEGYRGEE